MGAVRCRDPGWYVACYAGDAGFVSRVFMHSKDDFDNAVGMNVHHIATDKVNYLEDTWSRTHNAHGWPFACMRENCSGAREAGKIFGVEVASGALGGKTDEGIFLHGPARGDGEFEAMIFAPSSHTTNDGTACVMAREGVDAQSRYFAICRTAQDPAAYGNSVSMRSPRARSSSIDAVRVAPSPSTRW